MRAASAMLLLAVLGCPRQPPPDAGVKGGVTPTQAWLAGRMPASASQGTPTAGGTLTMRIALEPTGFSRIHDQMVEATMVRYTGATVYETLGRLSRTAPEGPPEPLLAESWAESPDHLTLTVHLRRGVTFHDGQHFSSRDVKAVIDVIRDEKNFTASGRSFFTELEALETPDADTVVVKWKRPYFLATRNFLTAVPMMPASALKGDFNTLAIHRAPIGTGPFKFEAYEPGQKITFVRNEAYWGKKPLLDKVVLRIVKDETVAAQLWERGEFDLMTRISPQSWRAVEAPTAENAWAVTGYNRIAFYENTYSWIGWNEARPYFADKRVRQALAMLYPRDLVARTIDLGLEPPTTCPYHQATTSCDTGIEQLRLDPERARKLLDEAGWKDRNGDGVLDKDGVPLKFAFLASAYSIKMLKLAALYQEQLRQVGVELDVEKVEPSVYIGRMRAHDFDAAALSWSSADAITDAYQLFHSSQVKGGSNYVSYQSARTDELLERIRTEFGPEERAALERQVHRQLYEDQVYLFLTLRPALDAAKVRVHGLVPAVGWYDLSKVWLSRD